MGVPWLFHLLGLATRGMFNIVGICAHSFAKASGGVGAGKVVRTLTSSGILPRGGPAHSTSEWVSTSPDGADDGLFGLVYCRITRDLKSGRLPPEFGTAAHQAQVWQSLPSVASQSVYGMNTNMSRWFQLIRRHDTIARY